MVILDGPRPHGFGIPISEKGWAGARVVGSGSAISVDQPDPHLVGTMEGSLYERRVRSGPSL